ncbi:MAG: hypothetical protein IKB71_04850 [Lentisphaeria bacterium]|nr:hypothetical protein [Lentisphaeria bacterium]
MQLKYFQYPDDDGRLPLLAPEIIHGVLTGQLDQIGVEKCKQPFPVLWDEQKKFFGIE